MTYLLEGRREAPEGEESWGGREGGKPEERIVRNFREFLLEII